MKKLMLGNEAVARGLYEGGCNVISSYPGTPSTEITECASKYKEDMYSEWAPNEKVAMEVAIGASIAGARSFCAMKHVGLNVAADPLFTATYTGVNGGMVIAVADDPGMHSSQNEQDSRHHARASKAMMLEPSDSVECLEFTKMAFDLSEEFDVPVIIRLSTRISHSQSIVEIGERKNISLKEYKKDVQKYVMMPANAIKRHVFVEQRIKNIKKAMCSSSLNKMEINNTDIGIVTSGISYQFAKEALGDSVSYLKLGCVWPMPDDLILEFASKVKKVYVIEELDDIFEQYIKALGVECKGKELFSFCGEYTSNKIKEVFTNEKAQYCESDISAPVRPPVLCPGCPHRGLFYTLSKNKVTVSGDIGCYTLGAMAPLSSIDTTICMGASISGLHGMNKARGEDFEKKSVAVIGDSTFMHSGITSLVDIVYNNSNSTVIILDNSITGMTGHQDNPTTGKNIYGDPAAAVNLEMLCRSIGINRVRTVDPYDIEEMDKAVKEELNAKEPSVIISRRPCVLLKSVKTLPPLKVDSDKCTGCKMCQKIGCPAIKMDGKKAVVDITLCVGCDLCAKVCKFDAIKKGDE